MIAAFESHLLDAIVAFSAFAFALASAALLSRLLGRLGGVFGRIVSQSTHKLASLEGLRGILSLSVVLHHACCWYFYTQTGVWGTGASIVFVRLAIFGVAQFFYISGFLFWRKLMKSGGISFGRFYLSRFVRIAPAYYVCVGIAILGGFALSHFRLQVPLTQLGASLLTWLLFSIGGQGDVNHADMRRITAGVTWTLALEWLFYLLLPMLGWFARRSRRLIFFALLFGFVHVAGDAVRHFATEGSNVHVAVETLVEFSKQMLLGFGGGILVAAFESDIRRWLRPIASFQNWIVLVCYAAYLCIPGIGMPGAILLLVAFSCVVEGADLFHFLTSRTIRFLGVISYPLYLCHGMVYFAASILRGGLHPMALPAYIAETAACLIVILLFATTIHLTVERPSMRLSEEIARRAALPEIAQTA